MPPGPSSERSISCGRSEAISNGADDSGDRAVETRRRACDDRELHSEEESTGAEGAGAGTDVSLHGGHRARRANGFRCRESRRRARHILARLRRPGLPCSPRLRHVGYGARSEHRRLGDQCVSGSGRPGHSRPHVESGADAQRLADACLLPPAGRRSWGGGRGTMFNEDEALIAAHGGKLGFSRWTNANMIVSAQIESKLGYDNLDAILAVAGLGVTAGGPNDSCASLGHPGAPNHPERQRLTADIERRARAAGKRASSDITSTLNLQELLLGSAREFARRHANDLLGT